MELNTQRLILRPWQESDAEELFELARDPELGPPAGWMPHVSVENSREIIRDVLSKPETYALILKENGSLAGSAGIFAAETSAAEEGELELGYWVARPLWGRGYAPEAVRELLRRCFEELGSGRVWCSHFDGNEKSRRCMEKCGFMYHHTEKDVPCPLIGEIRTVHYECIEKSTWERLLDR